MTPGNGMNLLSVGLLVHCYRAAFDQGAVDFRTHRAVTSAWLNASRKCPVPNCRVSGILEVKLLQLCVLCVPFVHYNF